MLLIKGLFCEMIQVRSLYKGVLMTKKKWTREDLIKVVEYFIEHKVPIMSHPKFRERLDRNRNLFANQVTREATGNVAYRSVDFDLNEMTDEEIWSLFDQSEYNELIEDNAAAAMMKMAEKLNLVK